MAAPSELILVLFAVVAALSSADRLSVPFRPCWCCGIASRSFGTARRSNPTSCPDPVPPLPDRPATSWRDFETNLRSISLLAVGLVLAMMAAVAAVAHAAIPDLAWPAASCRHPRLAGRVVGGDAPPWISKHRHDPRGRGLNDGRLSSSACRRPPPARYRQRKPLFDFFGAGPAESSSVLRSVGGSGGCASTSGRPRRREQSP